MNRRKVYAIVICTVLGVLVAWMAYIDLSTTTGGDGYIYQPSR